MEEKNYTVYKHTSPSNKVYIGITSMKPERRWANGYGYKNQIFYRAINKYGWNNFKHEILYINLTKYEAEKKEIDLIKNYNSTNPKFGYNVDYGGSATGKHSEITRRKMSINMIGDTRNKGRIHTQETRKHMSDAHIGVTLSEETKRKLSEINKGKTYSDIAIEHMKESNRKSRGVSIYCSELNMNFNSISEAVEYVNNIGGSIIRQGIQKVIIGKMNVTGKLSDGTRLHWEKINS